MDRQLAFGDPVESQHRRIDAASWEDIYVVGDVHGCRRELDHLLRELDPSDDDLVLFVGDLVRKGPENAAVVELVRDASNMLSVRGNNEEKLLRGSKECADLDADHLDWLGSLPVVISWAEGIVAHAGIDPRKPAAEHTVDTLQNVRSLVEEGGYERPFWFDRWDGPRRVFFGHTVLEDPVVGEYAVGLDTGCVYGGSLTAYDVRRETLVSVDADRTVQHRKPSKFISVSQPAV